MLPPPLSSLPGSWPFAIGAAAQAAKWPERPIHHNIPLTNMINRAFEAGTRDSSGRPGRNYWQIWIDYTINVRLDSATHVVSGRETVVFHNNSPEPIGSIRLRLDQNIFEPRNVRARVLEEVTYGMRVTKLAVNGQPVDLNAPAGGRGGRGGGFGGRGGGADNAGPRVPTVSGLTSTLATINLAEPVAAKGSVTIEAEWNFAVPNADARGLRMGRWGDTLYQVGQWYPQVAVYDDLRGWDTDPYLGDSEFYNNFGHFDVQIDVPAGWIVGATGTLQNPQEVLTADYARAVVSHPRIGFAARTSSRLTSGVREVDAAGHQAGLALRRRHGRRFAWGTSDRFVWDATRANDSREGLDPDPPDVRAESAAAYAAGGPVVRHALEFYSQLWMPYAFPSLTVRSMDPRAAWSIRCSSCRHRRHRPRNRARVVADDGRGQRDLVRLHG